MIGLIPVPAQIFIFAVALVVVVVLIVLPPAQPQREECIGADYDAVPLSRGERAEFAALCREYSDPADPPCCGDARCRS